MKTSLSNINTILFDLDDTLISTHTVFVKSINKAVRVVTKKTGLKFKEVKKVIDEAIIKSYETAKVNPTKSWPTTVKLVEKKYSLDSNTSQRLLSSFLNVYKLKPRRKKGVITILKRLRRKGIKLGLVTHASREWTDFKLEKANLKKYFDYVEVVDTNREKSGSDWEIACKKLKSTKDKCMIVGDNLKGDIISPNKTGFDNLVWINWKGSWSVYTTGELPKTALRISHISQLRNIFSL